MKPTKPYALNHLKTNHLPSNPSLPDTTGGADTVPDMFIRRPAVCQLTSLPSSSLTDLISKNLFPKPFKLSERMSAWKLSEVMEWMNTRERAA